MMRGCGDDQVGLRERVAYLAAPLDQQPPPEDDVFGDSQNALFKHRSHFVSKPFVKLGTTCDVGQQLDSETNFGQRHRTDVKQFKRLCRNERQHLALGFRQVPTGRWYRVATLSQRHVAYWQAHALRCDVDLTMRR